MGPNLEHTSNSMSCGYGRLMPGCVAMGPDLQCLRSDAAVNNTTRSAVRTS